MKWFFKILVLAILLQSFQCTDTVDSTTDLIPAKNLETQKQEIQNYINSFSCSESAGCGFIAFGSKPCGGPRSYLLYSKSINLTKLEEMVKTFNKMDELNNIQTNAVSDCMFAAPPTEVKCVNGICTIIK